MKKERKSSNPDFQAIFDHFGSKPRRHNYELKILEPVISDMTSFSYVAWFMTLALQEVIFSGEKTKLKFQWNATHGK